MVVWMEDQRAEGRGYRGMPETLGSDGYIHLNCDGFIGIYICQNLANYIKLLSLAVNFTSGKLFRRGKNIHVLFSNHQPLFTNQNSCL